MADDFDDFDDLQCEDVYQEPFVADFVVSFDVVAEEALARAMSQPLGSGFAAD